ncbi:MAG: penicillin-binding protein, partial [Rickettsiales bacterium]|nr:penicillin-binding protein [Rickettsiales bacterium]
MNLNRQNRRRSRPKLYKRRWFQILFLLFTTPIVIAIFYSIAILKSHQEKAQNFDLSAITKLEVPSRIYDRKGTEIGQIKIEDRRPIKLDKVPYHVIQALTAVEDSRFFEHQGVDFIGIARAIILNIKAKRITQGASTITQQLAKQCYAELKNVRNLDNKITEAFLANKIEKKFSKSEILEHYLNRIYFGSG